MADLHQWVEDDPQRQPGEVVTIGPPKVPSAHSQRIFLPVVVR